jgi:hypothetical protein
MTAPHSHDPDFWAAVETLRKSQQAKLCLAESNADPCSGKIIAAHTIPRSQLHLIAEEGHVYTLVGNLQTFDKTHGKLEISKKGIGTFSILNCFCADHDMRLFSPVENHPLSFTSEQITCLHYRAIAAEVYRKMTGLAGSEEVFSQALKNPKIKNTPEGQEFMRLHLHGTRLGIVDVGRTFKICEEALFNRKFDGISALVVRFRKPPAVMSVGGFSPEFDYDGKRLQDLGNEATLCDQISLSLISSEGNAALVLAWVRSASAPKIFADSLLKQPPDRYTTLIIQTVFEHLENTCMNVTWWDGLLPIERQLLTERMQTAIGPELRTSTALGYGGVTFDDWEYQSHDYVNI